MKSFTHKLFIYQIILIAVFICVAVFCNNNVQANNQKEVKIITTGYIPPDGFVPDKETATLIAFAVLKKIYGEQKIRDEQPFKTNLQGGVWTIEGSLPNNKPNVITAGGVAIIKLAQADARILYVNHGK